MIVVPHSDKPPPPSISEPTTKIKVWHLPSFRVFFLLLGVREGCPVDPVRESVARLIWRRRGVLLPLSSPCVRSVLGLDDFGNRITRQTKNPSRILLQKQCGQVYLPGWLPVRKRNPFRGLTRRVLVSNLLETCTCTPLELGVPKLRIKERGRPVSVSFRRDVSAAMVELPNGLRLK